MRYSSSGYKKFDAAGWYSYEEKSEPNQYRRNLALTFALAHEYRYQIKAYRDEDDYVSWYKFKLVKPLSEGDVAHKKFALYLIMHTELRKVTDRIRKTVVILFQVFLEIAKPKRKADIDEVVPMGI